MKQIASLRENQPPFQPSYSLKLTVSDLIDMSNRYILLPLSFEAELLIVICCKCNLVA